MSNEKQSMISEVDKISEKLKGELFIRLLIKLHICRSLFQQCHPDCFLIITSFHHAEINSCLHELTILVTTIP